MIQKKNVKKKLPKDLNYDGLCIELENIIFLVVNQLFYAHKIRTQGLGE